MHGLLSRLCVILVANALGALALLAVLLVNLARLLREKRKHVPGAALKLRSAGIAPTRFALGAYGSDAAHRPALSAIARRRAEALLGAPLAGQDVVIVGDTPADVALRPPH